MPPATNSIKNSGAVHLSCIAVLSNPRRLGTAGTVSLALDLHLLIGTHKKTILACYFNADGLSFEEPRVCSLNILVHLSFTHFLCPYLL